MTTSDPARVPVPLQRIRGYELPLIIILVAVAAISWSRRLSGPIDLRYDASTYYILGTSLAEGRGYQLLNEPGEIKATQYPPLLPLIVAAHQRLLGTHDPIVVGHWLRITSFLSYLAFAGAVYFTLRSYLPAIYAFIAALVCLLSLYAYVMSNQLAPETLFMLTTSLFFFSSVRGDRLPNEASSYLFAAASYGLRTIGIALFLAWIAEAFLKKQFRRALLRVILSSLPIISWQSYIHRVESSHDYKSPAYPYQRADYLFYNVSYSRNLFKLKDSFSPELGAATAADLASRFFANLMRVPASIGEVVTAEKKVWAIPFSDNHARTRDLMVAFILNFVGCLVLGGVLLQLIRRQWIVPAYLLCSIAIISFTPWPIQLVRYLTPLCPFLALSLVTSVLAVKGSSSRMIARAGRVAGLAFLVLVLSLVLGQQLVVFYRAHTRGMNRIVFDVPGKGKASYPVFGYFPPERALDDAINWLTGRPGSGEVVAAAAPTWVYVRTGLKAVMPPFELNAEKAQELLDAVPVTYLLLEENFTKKYVSSVIQAHPTLWYEIYSSPDNICKIYLRMKQAKLAETPPHEPLVAVARCRDGI
jgi:hypothetical protein